MVLIIAALGVAYYAVLAPTTFRERVTQTLVTERDPRLDTWSIARRVWEEHPVAGVGVGNFTVVEQAFLSDQINLYSARKLHNIDIVAHNTYLDVLTQLGLIGFALFGALLAMTIVPATRAVGRLDVDAPQVALTVRGLVAALVTLLAAYFFVSQMYSKQLWLLLGVLAAVPTLVRAAERARPAEPTGVQALALAEPRDDGRGLLGAAGPP
jgi:O-antigen ligase